MYKAFTSLFYQLHSSLCPEQTSAGKPTWESHLNTTPEAENGVSSYKSHLDQRQNPNDIHIRHWSTSVFLPKLYSCKPYVKNVEGRAVTFSAPLLIRFQVNYNNLTRTCLLWITIAREQGLCREIMTRSKWMLVVQGQDGMICKVPISERRPTDRTRKNSYPKITLFFSSKWQHGPQKRRSVFERCQQTAFAVYI